MDTSRNQSVNVTEVFKEISQNISQYNYRPRQEDMIAIRDCCFELSKLPAIELTVGGVGGWLVGTPFGKRLPAACLGMYLCYNAFDRTSTAEACLHRIMDLPTPLGAEAIEIVRAKDETSRHLRQVNELSVKPARIATAAMSGLSSNFDRQVPSQKQYEAGNAISQQGTMSQQDEPLWTTTDPFDICAESTHAQQPAAPHRDAKSQLEERRRKRQEAYRARRELRKQQREGTLLDGMDSDDDFRQQPR